MENKIEKNSIKELETLFQSLFVNDLNKKMGDTTKDFEKLLNNQKGKIGEIIQEELVGKVEGVVKEITEHNFKLQKNCDDTFGLLQEYKSQLEELKGKLEKDTKTLQAALTSLNKTNETIDSNAKDIGKSVSESSSAIGQFVIDAKQTLKEEQEIHTKIETSINSVLGKINNTDQGLRDLKAESGIMQNSITGLEQKSIESLSGISNVLAKEKNLVYTSLCLSIITIILCILNLV